MDPVYRCMQPYPYQTGQVHYRPYYYPSTEYVSTPVYADPAPVPFPLNNNGCCPWVGNYGYSYPVHGHGCCNPGHFPGNYAWRPPYSHAPQVHCHGNYPSFQATHTIPNVPVRDYSMGHPRYEYEKNTPRDHHCCGCPNHQCSKEEEKNVRTEEEDLVRENKSNESLVPCQLKNYGHPIVWFPSEYGNNEEHRKSKELEYIDQKENFHDNQKTIEQKQPVGNGWLPNDANLGSLKQRGDWVRNQNQRDDGNGHFPVPIFWMPYKPEEMEKKEGEVNNAGSEPIMEPIMLPDSGDNLKVNGEHANCSDFSRTKNIPAKQLKQLPEKENSLNHNAKANNILVKAPCAPLRMKDIPVMQVEQLHENENSGDHKAKENNVPVKDFIDNGNKKCSEGSAQRKSSSPKKASLPPVCLRVDPLRRKNTNGSSRSPSPPGDKGKLNQSSNKASVVPSSAEIVKSNVINDKESKNEATKKKPIEVMEGKTEQVRDVNVNTIPKFEKDVKANQTNERSTEDRECIRADKVDVEGQTNDTGSQVVENERISECKEVIANEVKEPKRKELTDLEAAIVIQSMYRGFATRRWEPLKKLRQIAEVREQISGIRLLIQEMELSSDIQHDNKQIRMIGESIMSLLLKLDTIQGLHSSIRDIRKSVARELVHLQEKLDSLISKKTSFGHESTNGVDEGALMETENDASNQVGHRVENTGVDGILSEKINDVKTHLVESCFRQFGNMDVSEPMLVGELVEGNLEKKSTEMSESCGIERIEAATIPDVKLGDELGYQVQEKEESILVEMTGSGQEMTDSPTTGTPIEVAELPTVVMDSDIDAQGCMEHRQIKLVEQEVAKNEIEEGSKAESVTTELKDNNRHDENKEDIEQCEESLPKLNDIQVQAEEKVSLIDEFVKMYDEIDDRIRSEVVMVDKLNDDGAEFDENTSKPSQDIGARIEEPKAANRKIGLEAVMEDKLGDDVAEPDECTFRPSYRLEDFVDDKLGDVGADSPEGTGKGRHGDSLSETDECTSRSPYYTGSKIKELIGVGGSEEIVHDKLGDVIAKSYECTSRLPQDVGEKISESTEATNELNLQMGESPCQGGNEIDNTLLEAFGGNDLEKSSTCEEVLDVSTEEKATLTQYEEQFQLDEHIEVQESESSDGSEKIVDSKCEVPDSMAFLPAGVIEPESPTASQRSYNGSDMKESNRKLMEDNEKLREMMEKLIKAGQEQLTTISSLSGRVKDLEKQLSKRKKLKMRRCKVPSSGLLWEKSSHGHLQEI